VHEILKLKGNDNDELTHRLSHLFAQIGELKVSTMYEKEILALGDHCVLPLTRFIQSEGSKRDRAKRVRAAEILVKIAQPWSVRDLIELLGDSDGDVRFYAAKALERLTDGLTHELLPQDWREAPADRRAELLQQWRAWWAENKDYYP